MIEINASPSLTASGKEDYDLKFGLLNDVLNVLDLENRLTGKEKRIGGWDLLWEDGPILADDGNMECTPNGTTASIPNSFLGGSQSVFTILYNDTFLSVSQSVSILYNDIHVCDYENWLITTVSL